MYFMGGQYQVRHTPGATGTHTTADAKHLPCFERPAHKASCRNLKVLKKLYLPEKECREIKHSYQNLSWVKAEDSHQALAFQAAGAPHPC
jgi:hypothetical protein